MDKKQFHKIINSIGPKKLALIFVLGILLIAFSFPSSRETTSKEDDETTEALNTTDAYTKKQEQRLKSVLKNVKGVGKVKVMITVKSSTESVINKDSPYEESTNETEKKVKEEEETVLVEEDGKKVPYVIKEIEPQVEGVIVVAQGGDSDVVSQDIVEAVTVLFHISSYKVKVLKMEDS